MTGFHFEQYVARLMTDQGFTVTMTPGSSDYDTAIVARQTAIGHLQNHLRDVGRE